MTARPVTRCPECDSTDLAWDWSPVKPFGLPDGRLTLRDVTTLFHLGCLECSATLIHSIHPDEIAAALNAAAWRPPPPHQ